MAIKCQWGDAEGTAHLERRISQCVSITELVNTVEQLFKGIPSSEHKAAAAKVCVCVCPLVVCVCACVLCLHGCGSVNEWSRCIVG